MLLAPVSPLLLLLLLPLLATLTSAAPTKTSEHDLQPRSFTSMGMTCYYNCPPISGYSFSKVTVSTLNNQATCSYKGATFTQTASCTYSSTSGALVAGSTTSSSVCPVQAGFAGCGSSAESPSSFRRAVAPRKLTKAQEIVAARQFKPKRAGQAAAAGVVAAKHAVHGREGGGSSTEEGSYWVLEGHYLSQ